MEIRLAQAWVSDERYRTVGPLVSSGFVLLLVCIYSHKCFCIVFLYLTLSLLHTSAIDCTNDMFHLLHVLYTEHCFAQYIVYTQTKVTHCFHAVF